MRPRRRQVALVRVPLPDECDSLEQAQRARHLDLASMSADEIEAEAERLRIFLLFVRGPIDGWYYERLARLQAVRRASAGGPSRRRPPPRSTTEQWKTW